MTAIRGHKNTRIVKRAAENHFYDMIIFNSGLEIWPRPFPLHHDASVLQNSPDFVDDYLHLDQQPAVTSPCGDVTFHPVVGEAGEGKRTV